MPRTKTKPTWTTQFGDVLLIEEMDDQHIINTIKMLWRNASLKAFQQAMKMVHGPQPRGDGAMMAFEQELDAIDAETFLHEAYDDLVMEANKRGLDYGQA